MLATIELNSWVPHQKKAKGRWLTANPILRIQLPEKLDILARFFSQYIIPLCF
jgi:hypothetical protein